LSEKAASFTRSGFFAYYREIFIKQQGGRAKGAPKIGNCRNLHQGWREGWPRGRNIHDLGPGVAVGLALWMEFSTIGVGAPKRQQLREVLRRLRQ